MAAFRTFPLDLNGEFNSLKIDAQVNVVELENASEKSSRKSSSSEISFGSENEVQPLASVLPIADTINNPTFDPYTFMKAEDFFDGKSEFNRPFKVTDHVKPDGTFDDIVKTGAVFRFNDQTLLLIQFIRPKVWRFRFESKFKEPREYSDFNTRTIICDTNTKLVDTLDDHEGIHWRTSVSETEESFCVESTQYPTAGDKATNSNGESMVRLYLEKDPFRMVAVRPLEFQTCPDSEWYSHVCPNHGGEPPKKIEKIIWKTIKKPLRWKRFGDTGATILTVAKSGSSKYIGFGEQGGKSFLKTSTFMNYFDYDNMLYNGVYGKGPLDEREPLYHSEPFWIELNTHQNMQSKVATFIDNYSQICIDFGKTNTRKIRTGTRFGSFQYFVMAGNDVPDVIRLYTSMVGRPHLKPRYVLGHHQGCYGYDTQDKVLNMAEKYRNKQIPLDGMHIDVDLQDGYRTFTTCPTNFPQAKDMFSRLRNMGIKCSTNITPVIKNQDTAQGTYKTLQEGLQLGNFVKDRRKTADLSAKAEDVRYIFYVNGQRIRLDPNDLSRMDWENNVNYIGDYADKDYHFKNIYNTGKEYHGGVAYGTNLGSPGFYPDLNRTEVRRWWGRQYSDLFDKGLEFVWQDMTSPCVNIAYGDMKGFPFRLLMNCDGWSQEKNTQQKAAIEMWSLYSYNLHKATYKGLNKLQQRKGKRNFIIGRGSFAGMHRYAGLWTGDNASTWDFFRVSVSQVLSSGLSGVTITGADVGGFMPQEDSITHEKNRYCDPELLIRWYCAYFMLPWFRNHYHGKIEQGMKWFQEPFIYTEHFEKNQDLLRSQEWLYRSVEPVCRYYVELRYTLIQLLYDAMFENQITGLPIARALIVTDTLDESLFTETSEFLSRQYMVRQDLLICPVMEPQGYETGNRQVEQWEIYLPQPNKWFDFNLRTMKDGSLGVPLTAVRDGGTKVLWDCSINNNEDHIPYITPMFIRAGGIIPQIPVRQYIADVDRPGEVTPLTIHIYPGRTNSYKMYLDDGVSRDSAPQDTLANAAAATGQMVNSLDDLLARSLYREVEISQIWSPTVKDKTLTDKKLSGHRKITVNTNHDGFSIEGVKKLFGDQYRIVLWHGAQVNLDHVSVETKPGLQVHEDRQARASVITLPVEDMQNITIDCQFSYS